MFAVCVVECNYNRHYESAALTCVVFVLIRYIHDIFCRYHQNANVSKKCRDVTERHMQRPTKCLDNYFVYFLKW